MSFWDLFNKVTNSKKEDKNNHLSKLHKELLERFPSKSETEYILIACMSGLLARIIYVDFEVHKNEIAFMKKSLKTWAKLEDQEVDFVVELAMKETKELAGLDQRHFCTALNEFLDNGERFHIVQTLFEIAASDGNVDSQETEEIRNINKALLLEHKHFVSAKNHVKEHLAALK